ncbi:PfaD family polyunsaturated fatty acid/polyketide biosynthesis protein [Kribbella sp. NPDC056861]|uniref:PfaD family polyunsaturated fatty acid/polyketide biosynthesis protein n=1 Tax=Kribbella sp. NPDC056861 TaxID=3154857 RepID=UPI0034279678
MRLAVAAPPDLVQAAARFRETVRVVAGPGDTLQTVFGEAEGLPVRAVLPPVRPEALGDLAFNQAHGTRFPYVAGEMANGISTTDLVVAAARTGLLGFYGAAGLSAQRVNRAILDIRARVGDRANWGVNLVRQPGDPSAEARMVDMLIRHQVPAVSLSGYTEPTADLVRLAATGLRSGPDGEVVRRTRLMVKVSGSAAARAFLVPPPADLLIRLAVEGQITSAEAALVAVVPLVTDITVEAGGAGQTSSLPLVSVLPRVMDARDRLFAGPGRSATVRIGVGGGLGTPQSVAAAFACGAAYVVTGSVNQACVESGISPQAKEMLARADVADFGPAPAADRFERGGLVQVLRAGTSFGSRAALLYQVYERYDGLEDVPEQLLVQLEQSVLGATIGAVWEEVRHYWSKRDASQLARAQAEPKHLMALVFRWYLGRSSWWAITGARTRQDDFQLWSGPALGAFNQWTAGSFLADPGERTVAEVGRNLLEGAGMVTRAQQLRVLGVPMPPGAFHYVPRRLVHA